MPRPRRTKSAKQTQDHDQPHQERHEARVARRAQLEPRPQAQEDHDKREQDEFRPRHQYREQDRPQPEHPRPPLRRTTPLSSGGAPVSLKSQKRYHAPPVCCSGWILLMASLATGRTCRQW